MNKRSTESLLGELARALPAVRPLPSIRKVAAGVLLVFGVAIVLNGWLGFPVPDFGRAVWTDFHFLALLCSLLAVAAGGTLAALTGAVPGREPEAQVATGVVIVGLLSAVAVGVAASLAPGELADSLPIQSSIMCIERGAALGLLPALAACFFLGRALPRRPLFACGLAILGAVGLGACFVHASCSAGNALHALMGHASAPLVATLVLLLPCALLVKLYSKHFESKNAEI